MPARMQNTRKRVYVELVRSLYTTLVPTVIMSAGYVVSLAIMARETNNSILAVFAGLGAISGSVRIFVLMRDAADAARDTLGFEQARQIERRFAVSYVQFALLLGISTAYVLAMDAPRFHILIVCLLVGYGAGVAAGVGLRPRIAIPSMLIAIVPGIAVLLLHRDAVYVMTGVMMAALLAGGSQSLLGRYRVTSAEIGKRLAFETLARRDILTRLPNRLALREWFENHVTTANGELTLAVYSLDLDGFKPVNDVFGHPAGDHLLKEIAVRLNHFIRAGDIVARVGGDEFVVMQRSVLDAEARSSAERLSRIVGESFFIRGHEVSVSCSIGYTVCRPEVRDLDDILELTDQALYAAKKNGGIECVSSLKELSDRHAA
jgi:diguanylate cyclase